AGRPSVRVHACGFAVVSHSPDGVQSGTLLSSYLAPLFSAIGFLMNPEPGSIEREFGVPFPGRILPPEKWTQTTLKQLPETLIDWPTLFGRTAPVILDLGCGNGRYSIGSALARPQCDHLATDVLPMVIRYARRRGNQRGVSNLKFIVLGSHELLARHIAPGSIQEIHCYHPQPYFRAAEAHKRLLTPVFLTLVHRSLAPGGLFVVQTDNPGYWKYLQELIPVFFDFHERVGPWPDAPRGRTRREIYALKQKLRVFRGSGTPKPGLTEEEAIRLAHELPPPQFDPRHHRPGLDD
ncbi:MAG: tRNA (guanine(46)-N(7))-methyltransferase TrmB, partial [Gemmataceae bacterium]